jgi:O-antigen ligase
MTEIAATRDSTRERYINSAFKALLYLLSFFIPLAKAVEGPAYAICLVLFCANVFLVRYTFNKAARTYYYILLTYLFVVALSLVFAPDFADNLSTLKQQCMLLLGVVIIEKISSTTHAYRYLWSYVAGASLLATIGIYQGLVMHVERPPTLMHPIFGGELMLFAVIISISLLFDKATTRTKTILPLLLLLNLWAIYLNGTRSVWLALVLILLFFPFICIKNTKIITALILGCLIVFSILLYNTNMVQQRLQAIKSDLALYKNSKADSSIGLRFEMWKASGRMFMKNPILGVGAGRWRTEMQDMISRNEAPLIIQEFNHTHSIYFDALSTKGVVGLLSLIVLLLYPVVFAWKRHNAGARFFANVVILMGLSFLILGLTETVVKTHLPFMAYITINAIALAVLVRSRPEHAQ